MENSALGNLPTVNSFLRSPVVVIISRSKEAVLRMMNLGIQIDEAVGDMEGKRRGVYPERPGMAYCAYYMRTGTFGYDSKCRYNYAPDRSSSIKFNKMEAVLQSVTSHGINAEYIHVMG